MSDPAWQPGTRFSGLPYWLIVRDAVGRNLRQLDIFSFGSEGQKLVPIFSDEGQAEMFSQTEAPGWRPRISSSGELISLLSCGSGPCAGVEGVILDPPPGDLDRAELRFISMSREAFLDHLIGRGRGWFDDEERKRGRLPGGGQGWWRTAGPEEASDGKEGSGAVR